MFKIERREQDEVKQRRRGGYMKRKFDWISS